MNVKKILSILMLIAGIAAVILFAIADMVGIGENPNFGKVQITGVGIGAVVAVIGLIVMLQSNKK